MAGRSIRLALVLSSLTLAFAAPARAQRAAEKPDEPLVFGTDASYEVRFDDDPLAALPNDAIIPRIVVLQGVRSARLHRPRTQFVPELLKSADDL